MMGEAVCLLGVLRRFQHCTGHITTGSWKGRGNQYKKFARVLYCKLPTNGKQLPAFPLMAMTGIEPRPQRWDVTTLPPWPPMMGEAKDNIITVSFIKLKRWQMRNKENSRIPQFL